MADIAEVVSVALLPEGKTVARDNMNVIACFTSEQGNVLNSNNRTGWYKSLKAVEEDFGSYSKAYAFAKVAFAQTPNMVNAGGALVIAYHRAVDENVPASSAILRGVQLPETEKVSELRRISDGSMKITIDGTDTAISGIDFRSISTLNDAKVIIDAAISDADVSIVDGRFTVTSKTAGAVSTITFASNGDSGTAIADIIMLTDGSGATLSQGADAATLTAETKEEAINEALKETYFVGFGFVEAPTDVERASIATWAKASGKIGYDVVTGDAVLEKTTNSIAWNLVSNSQSNYRLIHSKSNERTKWIAYAARSHTANFNAENSALTMHLKTLNGVGAESYTDGEVAKAKEVGLDIYTVLKDVPAILTSDGDDFVDNVYNLLAYIDAVRVDTYNLLKGTATKIPQTIHGVNQIVDSVEKTTRGFVRAGVFAPETWTSPDSFGDIDTFKRSIKANGFYVLAGDLADQPQSDRQARKSPVIKVAVKNAGAIHSVEIIINFNF